MDHLNIRSVTWNVAALDKPNNFSFNNLLELTESKVKPKYDIYAIGFQEVSARADKYLIDAFVSGNDPWTMTVMNELKPHDYVKIKSIRLLGLVLSVFCLKKHIPYLRNIETQYTRLSAGGYIGLKGAVSVRFEIYGTSHCFVCSHLSAHDHMLDTRVNEYNNIIENHKFKSELTQNILYHDYIIWMGDLNFRLREDTLSYNDIVQEISDSALPNLLEIDQLKTVQRDNLAFHELNEAPITFAPTFKHVIGSDAYDMKRRPAWTDRILSRVNTHNLEDLGIELSMSEASYTSHTDPQFRCSDHRPVSSNFATNVVNEKIANAKGIEGWKPIIRFFPTKKDNVPQDWFVNRDGKITYDLEAVAYGSRLLDTWDWIGLYHAEFESLDDYITFTWASACRRPGEAKHATIQDSALYSSGRFVLLYVSAKWSILGMSKPFEVNHFLPSPEAEEALEGPSQYNTKQKEL